MLLNLRTEFAESIFVHLRIGKSSVACKAATANTLREIHIVAAQLGKGNEVVGNTHFAC